MSSSSDQISWKFQFFICPSQIEPKYDAYISGMFPKRILKTQFIIVSSMRKFCLSSSCCRSEYIQFAKELHAGGSNRQTFPQFFFSSRKVKPVFIRQHSSPHTLTPFSTFYFPCCFNFISLLSIFISFLISFIIFRPSTSDITFSLKVASHSQPQRYLLAIKLLGREAIKLIRMCWLIYIQPFHNLNIPERIVTCLSERGYKK